MHYSNYFLSQMQTIRLESFVLFSFYSGWSVGPFFNDVRLPDLERFMARATTSNPSINFEHALFNAQNRSSTHTRIHNILIFVFKPENKFA